MFKNWTFDNFQSIPCFRFWHRKFDKDTLDCTGNRLTAMSLAPLFAVLL